MKKILTLALLFTALITISSCAKTGCTDPLAKNYDSKAKSDDQSCTYTGTLIIWQDETYAQSFLSAGTTTLKFYINGDIVGSMSAGTYSSAGVPACGANGFPTLTEDLGKNASKLFTIDMKDESNADIASYTVLFEGGKCKNLQIQ